RDAEGGRGARLSGSPGHAEAAPGGAAARGPVHSLLDQAEAVRPATMTRHKFLIATLLTAQILVPGCSDGSCDGPSAADPTRQLERDGMVERQIEARGV